MSDPENVRSVLPAWQLAEAAPAGPWSTIVMTGRSLLEKTWLDGACWFTVGGSQKKNALPARCVASWISADGPGGNARSARQPTIPARTRDSKAIRFIRRLPVGAWYNPQLGANLGRLRRPARLRFSRCRAKRAPTWRPVKKWATSVASG